MIVLLVVLVGEEVEGCGFQEEEEYPLVALDENLTVGFSNSVFPCNEVRGELEKGVQWVFK